MPPCDLHLQSYRIASLNGIEFFVFSTDDEGGQRGPTHEYPDRQTPYSEFLGRKAHRFRIQGYFNGDDHVALMRDLRDECDIPAPARLVHPTLGSLSVKVETYSINHEMEDRERETHFTLDCVEAGVLSFPVGIVPFGFQVFQAVQTIRTQVNTTFNSIFSVAGLPSYLASQVLAPASEAAEFIAERYQGLVEWNETTVQDFRKLENLASFSSFDTDGVWNIIGNGIQSLSLNYQDGAKDRIIEALGEIGRWRPSFETVQSGNPNADTIDASINVLTMSVRVSAIAEQARITLEDQDYFKSYSAALSWLDEIRTLLGQELVIAENQCDTALFKAINGLMKELTDAVHDLGPSLPSRRIVQMCDSVPSLVAAYRLLGNANQDNTCCIEDSNPSASTWYMPTTLEVVTPNA